MHFCYFEISLFQAIGQCGQSKKRAGNELSLPSPFLSRISFITDVVRCLPAFLIVFEMEGLFLTYSTMKPASNDHLLYLNLAYYFSFPKIK